MRRDLEESALRFGQGLVVAICLSIVIIMCAWALAEAYLLESGR